VLGLRQNLAQFALLVLVNAFVGGMVGMERSVLPLLGRDAFHIASLTLVMSFIASFGATKALTNLLGARLSESVGRRRLLIAGWIAGLAVPLMLLWAPGWQWVIIANVLLGVNQGLCWSMTVIMKIDLVGPKRRGLAMGLNEFAGYVAVAVIAFVTAILAARYGLRPAPFELGVAIAAAGLLVSLFFVKETYGHAVAEGSSRAVDPRDMRFSGVFARTTLTDPTLSACSQAGFINNLNDGMIWGLLPLMAVAAGFSLPQVGALAAVYPLIWGVAQLFTGAASDVIGRKWLIAGGMAVQAGALGLLLVHGAFVLWLVAAVALGIGTAMVYPTLLAAIGDVAHPSWRASAVGVYRLWRDAGYAVGALAAGIVADLFGTGAAVALVAVLTLSSGAIVAARMKETLNLREQAA
jgi:MFS family permease